jgi:hypothetical protein
LKNECQALAPSLLHNKIVGLREDTHTMQRGLIAAVLLIWIATQVKQKYPTKGEKKKTLIGKKHKKKWKH